MIGYFHENGDFVLPLSWPLHQPGQLRVRSSFDENSNPCAEIHLEHVGTDVVETAHCDFGDVEVRLARITTNVTLTAQEAAALAQALTEVTS
jgi:hypothetical protein